MARGIKILFGVLAALALLVATAYVLRDPIATAAFGAVTDRDKIRCAQAGVKVARSLDTVEVGPLDCEIGGSPLLHVEIPTPTHVALRTFGVDHVDISRATFNYRERDLSHVHMNTLAELASFTGMPEQ